MNSPDAMISVALGLSKGTVSIPFFFGARLDADIRFLDLPPELAAEAGAPPATPTIPCSATAEEPTALASRYCATALCRHSGDRSRMSLEMFRRPSTKASSRLRPPFASVLDLIGETPVVELKRFDTGRCRRFVKIESQNPGGSIKDRIALSMIVNAEQRGQLARGGTIIEATAGNTGLGLAIWRHEARDRVSKS